METEIFYWLLFGVLLVLSEFLLPGLVAVFVGLGALTVASLLHFEYIGNFAEQFIAWALSSTVYIFTLRLFVVRFYPSDRVKQSIDEDLPVVGMRLQLTEAIVGENAGRVNYGDSSWSVKSADAQSVPKGAWVEMRQRDNIFWVVKAVDGEK